MSTGKKWEIPYKGFGVTEIRPGLLGQSRAKRVGEYNSAYGLGNWTFGWKFDSRILTPESALRLYERSYEIHFLGNRIIWNDLIRRARDVWVEEESDVESGLDYSIQKAKAAHYEDIAIRRILRGWERTFKGKGLVRVRGDSDSLCGKLLSSQYVPFVAPAYIEEPRLDGWWKRNSVEDFWQSNKILLVKEEKKL